MRNFSSLCLLIIIFLLLMDLVNLGSLIIQFVNLSVVVYVLYRFIFKPYLAFIDEETAKREAFEANVHASEHIISDA